MADETTFYELVASYDHCKTWVTLASDLTDEESDRVKREYISCMRNIAECEGGRLYQYNGSWCCRECTIENVLEDLDTIEAGDTYDD